VALRRRLDDGNKGKTLVNAGEEDGERSKWKEWAERDIGVWKEVDDEWESEKEGVPHIEEAIRPLNNERGMSGL
jgi:hypothetical protein